MIESIGPKLGYWHRTDIWFGLSQQLRIITNKIIVHILSFFKSCFPMLSYTVQDNIRESGNSRVLFCSFLVPKVGHDGFGPGPDVMSDHDGFGPGPAVMSGT